VCTVTTVIDWVDPGQGEPSAHKCSRKGWSLLSQPKDYIDEKGVCMYGGGVQ
jgi:hypothetical protein